MLVGRACAQRLVALALRTEVGVRALAWVCRRHPRLRGVNWVRDDVFERVPRSGSGRATFGRRRTILCDFSVMYDRSVYSGREETQELELVRRLLSPGARFVDAGANIGLFTVFAAAAVGVRGMVASFEPVPETLARLRANVLASRCSSQVQIFAAALSDTLDHEVDLGGRAHNVMRIGSDSGDDLRVTAPTVTIDAALVDRPVDGMKIDVEGHERAVLRGAQQTIDRDHPWMLVEFNTDLTGDPRLDAWDVHRHLAARGYTAHLPGDLLRGALEPLTDDWENPYLYVNVLYWWGTTPRKIG